MNKTRLTTTTMAIAVLTLSACGSAEQPSADQEKTVSLTASYPEAYKTLDDLVASSDAIVLGSVVGSSPATPVDGLPFTNADVQVKTWLKQDGEYSDIITIHQTGGVLEGVNYVSDEDPLLQIGETEVFYLKKIPEGYMTVGGPTGRLNVLGNKVEKFPESTLAETLPVELPAVLRTTTNIAGK
ncbi:hypothetical protein [Arthrobacter citreus]|uniref:hypothetical protein n=1 Tax=Arthrobacter citreus TaxID=1670 RepID=UPI003823AAB3